MQQNGDTIELTEFEQHIREVVEEDWEEGTDPHPVVLDQAAAHGETIEDAFVHWLCAQLILASTGFQIGMPYAGSIIEDFEIESDHELSLDLADGRTIVVGY